MKLPIYLDYQAVRDGHPSQQQLLDHYGADIYYQHWEIGPPVDRLAVRTDLWFAGAKHARAVSLEPVARRDDVFDLVADVMDPA